jgi:uncharacterized linocin/CFP29 family protein
MNNLHRELAPVSSAAWSQIEEEVARTFKRSIAGRRVVDVKGPGGVELAGVGPATNLQSRPRSRMSMRICARSRLL